MPSASTTDRSALGEPVDFADQLVRYNPETGMMDVSYASAWQIGRLLGLQNKEYSLALYDWKQSNARKTALALEHDIIEEKFGDMLATAPGDGDISSMSLCRTGIEFIRTSLGPHLTGEHSARDMGEPT
jgi:hypothetical protein